MTESEPRPYTVEEMRAMFLDAVRSKVDYWANTSDHHMGRARSLRETLSGLAFSIMVLLDGGSSLPGFELKPTPHPEDAEFFAEEGENWWTGEVIHDSSSPELHDQFYNDGGGQRWRENNEALNSIERNSISSRTLVDSALALGFEIRTKDGSSYRMLDVFITDGINKFSAHELYEEAARGHITQILPIVGGK